MQTKIITITEEEQGRRADNLLFTLLKNVPKSRIYRAIRNGEVRVNGKRIKVDHRLQLNDQMRIPPISQPEQAPKPQPSNSLVDLLKDSILYEDNTCLVLNKPSGIAVHGGSGVKLGIIEALRIIYPKLSLELAHRLDRDTSGCLIVAKKHSAARHLHEQFRQGTIEKFYLCLLKGKLSSKRIIVDKPLFKNQLSSGERIVKIDKERGKPSLSIFNALETYNEASLVEVELKTGRTHQIRVHAASLGNPIAEDSKYGDKEFNQTMRALGLKRLFLHAAKISFIPPGQTNAIRLEAPLDASLINFLSVLT